MGRQSSVSEQLDDLAVTSQIKIIQESSQPREMKTLATSRQFCSFCRHILKLFYLMVLGFTRPFLNLSYLILDNNLKKHNKEKDLSRLQVIVRVQQFRS